MILRLGGWITLALVLASLVFSTLAWHRTALASQLVADQAEAAVTQFGLAVNREFDANAAMAQIHASAATATQTTLTQNFDRLFESVEQ